MTAELHNPVDLIFREIANPKMRQIDVAYTYAFILRQEPKTAPWENINWAIMQRWPGKSALTRIKETAWKIAEGKGR